MTTDVADAVETTRVVLDNVDRMIARGWALDVHLPTFTLRRQADDPALLAADLRMIASVVTDGRLRGEWANGLYLELQLVDDGYVLSDSAGGELEEFFPEETLGDAQQAWNGDADAALRLRGTWNATIGVDPACCLDAAVTGWKVYVVSDLATAATFLNRPWWRLGELLNSMTPVLILTWRDQEDYEIRTGMLAIQPFSSTIPESTQPPASAPARPTIPEIPDPRSVAPTEIVGAQTYVAPIATRLWNLCAASAWGWLATTVTIDEAQQVARLQYFGLQRVEHTMPADGPDALSEEHCRDAYELWRWAAETEGPDRLLAVRQIISLYRDVPWGRGEDVRLAAEPVFLSLRSDVIAEGFKAQREARAVALTVARQTAEATTGLSKGAVERCLAALAATGGIVIAKTSATLTASQAADLRMLLAVFLLILAGWSTLIEGPAVTVGLRGLRDDVAALSPLLPEAEQRAILNLSSVKRAKRHALRVRIAVPVAYVAAAIAAALVR